MRLGKRYVAVWRHGQPTSDPRADEPWVTDDLRMLIPLSSDARPGCSCSDPHEIACVLVVDLDTLPDASATDEQRYQHAEAMMQFWAAEEQRLRPATYGGKPRERTIDVDLTLADYDALGEIRKALTAYWDTPTRWFELLDRLRDRLPAQARPAPTAIPGTGQKVTR